MPPSSATQTPASTPTSSVDDSVLLARSSPGGLALATDPRFQYPAHVELIDNAIVEAIAGVIPPRLIIETPPRHGKSETVSKWAPAWFLGTYPDRKVILASYEADFASTWGYKARQILEQVGTPIFGITVSDDSRARNRWELKQTWTPNDPDLFDWLTGAGGGMITAGVGGPITGKGGDLLIVDDPVKNRKEADSETLRRDTREWWQSTAYTRLEPGAIAIVIQTRWHEDDLAGWLRQEMAAGGEEWHTIRLPAIAEKGDQLGRKPGKALWPWRYDEVALARIRKAVGSRTWEALYQQRPAPAEGGTFKDEWWRYYPAYDWPRVMREICQSWDCAFKKKTDSDFVVGQVWGRDGSNPADKYLLAQVRARMNYPETKKAMRALTAWCYKRGLGSQRVLVEDKANGSAIISELQGEIEGLIPVEPEGGKEARANAVSGQVESGNVYLPEGLIPAPPGYDPTSTETFTGEMRSFPTGANDDQVDTMSQALVRFSPPVDIDALMEQNRNGGGLTDDLLTREM